MMIPRRFKVENSFYRNENHSNSSDSVVTLFFEYNCTVRNLKSQFDMPGHGRVDFALRSLASHFIAIDISRNVYAISSFLPSSRVNASRREEGGREGGVAKLDLRCVRIRATRGELTHRGE